MAVQDSEKKMGGGDLMIDIHMHVIPGVDDGSGSMEESLTMLRSAAAQGVKAVVATPHSSALYKNSQVVRERFEALRKAVRKEDIPVHLYYGRLLRLRHMYISSDSSPFTRICC